MVGSELDYGISVTDFKVLGKVPNKCGLSFFDGVAVKNKPCFG